MGPNFLAHWYIYDFQVCEGRPELLRTMDYINRHTTFDSDAIDISVPSGCTALSDPVQLPGYGRYKTIIYIENM